MTATLRDALALKLASAPQASLWQGLHQARVGAVPSSAPSTSYPLDLHAEPVNAC